MKLPALLVGFLLLAIAGCAPDARGDRQIAGASQRARKAKRDVAIGPVGRDAPARREHRPALRQNAPAGKSGTAPTARADHGPASVAVEGQNASESAGGSKPDDELAAVEACVACLLTEHERLGRLRKEKTETLPQLRMDAKKAKEQMWDALPLWGAWEIRKDTLAGRVGNSRQEARGYRESIADSERLLWERQDSLKETEKELEEFENNYARVPNVTREAILRALKRTREKEKVWIEKYGKRIEEDRRALQAAEEELAAAEQALAEWQLRRPVSFPELEFRHSEVSRRLKKDQKTLKVAPKNREIIEQLLVHDSALVEAVLKRIWTEENAGQEELPAAPPERDEMFRKWLETVQIAPSPAQRSQETADLLPRLLEIRNELQPWRRASANVVLVGDSTMEEVISTWAADSKQIRHAIAECSGEPPEQLTRTANANDDIRAAMAAWSVDVRPPADAWAWGDHHFPRTSQETRHAEGAQRDMLKHDAWQDGQMRRTLRDDVRRDLNLGRPAAPFSHQQPIAPTPHFDFSPIVP